MNDINEKEKNETIDREEIIEKYIEHVRNISELDDDEIESVINDAIEEDEEVLDVLQKFLVKREKIREKVVTLDIDTNAQEESEEDQCKDDDNKEDIKDIIGIFEYIDDALLLEDIIQELKDLGYVSPGDVILDALRDELLYVDDIDDDGNIYLALAESGEKLWELKNP